MILQYAKEKCFPLSDFLEVPTPFSYDGVISQFHLP